jgi:uncharacterized protein
MKRVGAMRLTQKFLLIALGACVFGAAGCSSVLAPEPDLSKFYILTSQPAAGQVSQASAGAGMSIGVGPITMPDYLDRPEMVTRTGTNELRLSENSRWGEPLNVGFAHVFARDLAMRLGAAQIHRFPWYNSASINYQVEVAVHHFETDASGRSELIAHWTIIDGRNHDVLDSANTTLAQSGAPADMAASVAALSHILGQFSDQIATRLRRVAEQHQARAQTQAR